MLPANLMGILLAPWGQMFLYPAHPRLSKHSPAPQLFPTPIPTPTPPQPQEGLGQTKKVPSK